MRGEVRGSGRKPDVLMSSTTPGFLELSPQKMEKWITQQPIEEHYEVEEQPFARGKYAAVRMCRHRTTGVRYAAKFLRKRRRSEDLRPEILHEVAILDACADSPRIVQLHKVFESESDMVLLLELAPGGELQMLLDRDEVPEERQVRRLMRQILDGLAYLHSINVAHLDIKPQNLVLTDEFPHCEVKLCDLGISRYISQGADIRDMLGTPDYVAPEVLNFEPISLATDMWSVGVLLYVLLTGCSPFGGDTKQETFCNISKCILDFPEDLFEDISEDAKDLMCKLIVKDPSQRLTAEQSLKHQWFMVEDDLPTPVTNTALSNLYDAELLMARVGEKIQAQRAALAQRVANIRAEVESEEPAEERRPPLLARRKSLLRNKTDEDKKGEKEETKRTVASVPERAGVTSTETNEDNHSTTGMKSFRRQNFVKNMGSLAEKFASINMMDNEATSPSNYKNNNFISCTTKSDKSTDENKTPVSSSSGKSFSRTITTNAVTFSTCATNVVTSVRTVPSAVLGSVPAITVSNSSVGSVKNTKPLNVTSTFLTTGTTTTLTTTVGKIVTSMSVSTLKPGEARSVSKATAMQTMPVGSLSSYRLSLGSQAVGSTIMPSQVKKNNGRLPCFEKAPQDVIRRRERDKKDLFSFRKCIIIDDSEDDVGTTVSPPLSIASDTSSGFCDQLTSDSGSDSVSEMSIDSSSDRSSIISLDEPVDYSYSKQGNRHFVQHSHRTFTSNTSGGVANALRKSDVTARYPASRFTSFSRLSSVPGESLLKASTNAISTDNIFALAKKQAAKSCHTTYISKMESANLKPIAPAQSKEYGLNIVHERKGDIVVLREVKCGKYSRFSEVKCESVQARIKKFQS
ncbi:death-associated protein kinase related-like [Schistocerca cancellata]|uniref:death-associated protein kinase related-like n=1 Tax=Schistocerca cancellata TaxID=274614 RepID=UPI00211821FE|nr:death-associated protein kinase related-like [Schistocerca cancellata]